MSKWISVDNNLPVIPKSKSGIVCDIWVKFNLDGKGSRVPDACYEYRCSDTPEFHGNGCDISEFTVTHWMLPEPPETKP